MAEVPYSVFIFLLFSSFSLPCTHTWGPQGSAGASAPALPPTDRSLGCRTSTEIRCCFLCFCTNWNTNLLNFVVFCYLISTYCSATHGRSRAPRVPSVLSGCCVLLLFLFLYLDCLHLYKALFSSIMVKQIGIYRPQALPMHSWGPPNASLWALGLNFKL